MKRDPKLAGMVGNLVGALKRLHGKPTARDERAKNQRFHEETDWANGCGLCGDKPVVRETGMCGPCTFGEADTAGGNW